MLSNLEEARVREWQRIATAMKPGEKAYFYNLNTFRWLLFTLNKINKEIKKEQKEVAELKAEVARLTVKLYGDPDAKS